MQRILSTLLFAFLLANVFAEATLELMDGKNAILAAGTKTGFL
jgi:hypothetical protein